MNFDPTIDQLKIVVDSLNYHYEKKLAKITEQEERSGNFRTVKIARQLADIQETVQYFTLWLTIKSGKLSAPLQEALDSARQEELDGTKTEKGVST